MYRKYLTPSNEGIELDTSQYGVDITLAGDIVPGTDHLPTTVVQDTVAQSNETSQVITDDLNAQNKAKLEKEKHLEEDGTHDIECSIEQFGARELIQLASFKAALEGYQGLVKQAGKNLTPEAVRCLAVGLKQLRKEYPVASLEAVNPLDTYNVANEAVGEGLKALITRLLTWLRNMLRRLGEWLQKLLGRFRTRREEVKYLKELARARASGMLRIRTPEPLTLKNKRTHAEYQSDSKALMSSRLVSMMRLNGRIDLEVQPELSVIRYWTGTVLPAVGRLVNESTGLLLGMRPQQYVNPDFYKSYIDEMDKLVNLQLTGLSLNVVLHGDIPYVIKDGTVTPITYPEVPADEMTEVDVPSYVQMVQHFERYDVFIDELERLATVGQKLVSTYDQLSAKVESKLVTLQETSVDPKLVSDVVNKMLSTMDGMIGANGFGGIMRYLNNFSDDNFSIYHMFIKLAGRNQNNTR